MADLNEPRQESRGPRKAPLEARDSESSDSRTGGRSLRGILLRVLLVAVVVTGVVVAYRWWEYARVHESTDDAYVHGTISTVAPRVEGRVIEVFIDDNQPVRKGDVLVRLDPVPFQVAVEEAQATVDMAKSRLDAARASVTYNRDLTGAVVRQARAKLAVLGKQLQSIAAALQETKDEIAADEAVMKNAERSLSRYRILLERGAISQDQVDQASTQLDVATAKYRVAKAAIESKQEELAATRAQRDQVEAEISQATTGEISTEVQKHQAKLAEAQLGQARAQLHQAQLNLSYSEIRAPIDGYVSKKSVDVGNYVSVGSPLLAIVALHDVWIEANFKENQLDLLRIGQPVEIIADSYPDHPYQGHIESFSSGTGDAFSLLPAENATGNWIKVTRRVPVRIALDQIPPPDFLLRIGMSITATVDIRDQSGAPLQAAAPSPKQEAGGL
jgi:membrane fusion protein (multidrug efflux system)